MKYSNFECLLTAYNKYFYMSSFIDEDTFSPIFEFVCKNTNNKHVIKVPRIDILDYNNDSKKMPKSIKNMVDTLKSIRRDYKLNLILNGTNNN